MRTRAFLAPMVTLLMVVAVVASGASMEMVPTSYTAPPGDFGWICYYDDSTGRELIDGVHGTPWSGEPGFPGENEQHWRMGDWVAWDSHPVTITFRFAQACHFSRIDLFTGRGDSASIYIPGLVSVAVGDSESSLLAYGEWAFDNGSYSDGCRHTLSLSVNTEAVSVVQVTLQPTTRWIFLDEVDFYGTPVPEPSSLLALVCGLGGLGMVWRRRR